MVDVNKIWSDPKKRLFAAQSSLLSTETGRAGGIRIDQDANGIISYISNITGKKHKTIEEAFVEVGSVLLTNFNTISKDASIPGTAAYNARFAQVAPILSRATGRT